MGSCLVCKIGVRWKLALIVSENLMHHSWVVRKTWVSREPRFPPVAGSVLTTTLLRLSGWGPYYGWWLPNCQRTCQGIGPKQVSQSLWNTPSLISFLKTGLRWESNPGFLLLWKPANNYTSDTKWMDDRIMADESITVECNKITFK